MTHPHPKRSFVPLVVLTSTVKINTAGANVNTAGASINTVNRPINTADSTLLVNHPRPKSNAFKRGYSQSSRPFNRYYANKNSIINTNVNTTRVKNTTARDRAVVSENKGIGANAETSVILMNMKTMMVDLFPLVMELKYNLFSMSQICDKKNNVLFTDTECLVLSSDFKLLDKSQVLLRVPRKDNIYNVDLKSVVPTRGLACLIAKAIIDESNTWHRRHGHINFKTMNKLVKGNLVKGLPSKIFVYDHSCVACLKGKQHKASYKTKLVNSISKRLHMLHMDLFGPTNVKSLMKKSYCLVVTDDFSSFSWVFFLVTKDETSGILKTFITEIENQLDHKVKVIRTPQQNGVSERKNRTLIEVVRTRDHLGKFDGKADEGYFVGYSMDSEGDTGMKPSEVDERGASDKNKKDAQDTRSDSERLNQSEMQTEHTNSTNSINTISTPVSTTRPTFDNVVPSPLVNTDGPSVSTANAFKEHLFERFSPFKNAFTLPPILNVSSMDNTGIFGNAYNDEDLEE
ncbi:putative ribonuclease H-like domain-containing protein [Tanacetum coccineum]